jgi:hypothetical protein
MQLSWPVSFWKRPPSQRSQALPFAKLPASHFVQNDWPLVSCTDPGGHGSHVSWFFSTENVCTAQGSHVRSAVLVALARTAWPGGQVSASANGTARDPMQKCAGGHASHVPLVTLPNSPAAHATSHVDAFAALKVLQSQRVHESVPNPALNCPAGHALQAAAPSAADPGGHGAATSAPLHSAWSPTPGVNLE